MNKWFERKFAKYGNDMNQREGKGKKWVNEDFLFFQLFENKHAF